jgi:hypothetical protein
VRFYSANLTCPALKRHTYLHLTRQICATHGNRPLHVLALSCKIRSGLSWKLENGLHERVEWSGVEWSGVELRQSLSYETGLKDTIKTARRQYDSALPCEIGPLRCDVKRHTRGDIILLGDPINGQYADGLQRHSSRC